MVAAIEAQVFIFLVTIGNNQMDAQISEQLSLSILVLDCHLIVNGEGGKEWLNLPDNLAPATPDILAKH